MTLLRALFLTFVVFSCSFQVRSAAFLIETRSGFNADGLTLPKSAESSPSSSESSSSSSSADDSPSSSSADPNDDGLSSSSSAVSSSSSAEEELVPLMTQWELKKTTDEVSPYSRVRICPPVGNNKRYMNGEIGCEFCSICKSPLYARESCKNDRDTECEWCFSKSPVKNADYQAKCGNIKQSGSYDESFEENDLIDPAAKSYMLSAVSIDSNYWWKVEIIMEVCFYVALIALIISIIRFLSKTKSYRTVHITAPVLDVEDQKNIVKAAESIRNKLGKKDYERLEEFI